MKRSEIIFTTLLVPFDIAVVFLAFIFAYWFRSAVEIPKTSLQMWPFIQYITFILPFLPVWTFFLAIEGLYNIKRPKNGLSEFLSIFLASSAGIAIVVLGLFFSRFLFFSRLVIVYAWISTFIFVYLARLILKGIQGILYKKGSGIHRVLIVGESDAAKKITEEIKNNPYLGLKLVKKIDRAGIEKIETIFERTEIDDVILADPGVSKDEAGRLMAFCEEKRVGFKMIPDVFRMKITNFEMGALSSYPILSLKITPLEGWGGIFKRLFDVIFASFCLIILSPLFLILAVLIKIGSKGPVFFKHKRAGTGGKPFYLLKFRSMVLEAPAMYKKLASKEGVFLNKIKNDPRITKLGHFLRRTNLDELPQLFNVLRGEMSLVGPRPLTIDEFKNVSNYEKKYLWVSYVKPGMSGLWQVTRRNEYSHNQRVALDIYYVENWSPFLDLWILTKTPKALISTKSGS